MQKWEAEGSDRIGRRNLGAPNLYYQNHFGGFIVELGEEEDAKLKLCPRRSFLFVRPSFDMSHFLFVTIIIIIVFAIVILITNVVQLVLNRKIRKFKYLTQKISNKKFYYLLLNSYSLKSTYEHYFDVK